jgi:hypothetical protein
MGRKLGDKRANGHDKAPHVFIATPAYNGKVDSDYSQSMCEAAWLCARTNTNFSACVMGNGAFIDLARNNFVRIFLEEQKECTHLFFIDSDLKFEARAVVELVRHCTPERPVVAGAYCRRHKPGEAMDFPIMWTPHPDIKGDQGQDALWLDDDAFLMADRVATGFLCIRREILQEMWDKAEIVNLVNAPPVRKLFHTYLNEENQFVGEDFAWCIDYKAQYNRPISVWCDFDFVHDGIPCNYLKWLDEKCQEVEAALKQPPPRKLGDGRR